MYTENSQLRAVAKVCTGTFEDSTGIRHGGEKDVRRVDDNVGLQDMSARRGSIVVKS